MIPHIRIEEYDYPLPDGRIAKYPLARRDASKLLEFRDGKITHPIREMVVTGNMITLWNGILAAGTDARPCTRWQIPTLAFNAADFSA